MRRMFRELGRTILLKYLKIWKQIWKIILLGRHEKNCAGRSSRLLECQNAFDSIARIVR